MKLLIYLKEQYDLLYEKILEAHKELTKLEFKSNNWLLKNNDLFELMGKCELLKELIAKVGSGEFNEN